jgi:outer membrane receptor for ferrienterochelin and colicin
LLELLSGHDIVTVLDQEKKNLERLFGEPGSLPVRVQLTRLGVELELADVDNLSGERRGIHGGPSDRESTPESFWLEDRQSCLSFLTTPGKEPNGTDLRTLLLVIALTVAADPASGQFAQAELLGVVTTRDGAGLQGVIVTAVDEGTGLRRSVTTMHGGTYALAGLKPGRYSVTFELQGLRTLQSRHVELRLGQKRRLNPVLEMTSSAETITVTAKSQLLDVDSKQVGDTLTAEEFRDLPTQDRSFVLFAALVPGVIPNPQTSSSSADALYINGQHQANNSFRVDGARNDDSVVGSQAGAQVRIAIEAIQEFQVLTTQYDAEFGAATGGMLNAITKSGANEVKGSAFAFFQDAKWNSKDFFTERAGLARPRASFDSAGFTAGGPILRDRLHYFMSFERAHDREGHSRFFTSRPELSFSTAEDNEIRNVLGRVDYQLARNHHASFRYLAEDAPQLNKIVGTRAALEGAREEHDSDANWIAALDSIASGNGLNSLRASYTNEHFINAASPFGKWARNAETLQRLPPLLIRPSVDEGPSTFGQDQRDESVDLADTVSLLAPRGHELRAGVQWARRAIDLSNFGSANGSFGFDTDRSFDPNDISTYPTSFTIRVRGAAIAKSSRNDTLGLFMQDDFRVRNNLTVSAGLRWDREDVVADHNNFAPRLGFAWSPAGRSRTVVRGGAGRFYDQMRLGLWSMLILDRVRLTDGLVVRVPDAGTNRQYFFDLARSNQITSLAQLRDLLRTLQERTTSQLNLNPTVDQPGRVQPYVDTITIGIHHEVSSTVAAGVDLVQSESKGTLVLVDLNPFSRARGGRPNISILNGDVVRMGSISTALNAGRNRYRAVQMSVRKRASGRLSGRISYTYADSEGNYGNAGPLGAPNTAYFQTRSESGYNFDTGEIIGEPLRLNFQDPRNDGQPVGWQRRHNLVIAGVWLVPRTSGHEGSGLSLSWLYRYMSGDRFTIFTTDLLDNGAARDIQRHDTVGYRAERLSVRWNDVRRGEPRFQQARCRPEVHDPDAIRGRASDPDRRRVQRHRQNKLRERRRRGCGVGRTADADHDVEPSRIPARGAPVVLTSRNGEVTPSIFDTIDSRSGSGGIRRLALLQAGFALRAT